MEDNKLLMIVLAFILGFIVKILLGTLCGNRLIEGNDNCIYADIRDPKWTNRINSEYFCKLMDTDQEYLIRIINNDVYNGNALVWLIDDIRDRSRRGSSE